MEIELKKIDRNFLEEINPNFGKKLSQKKIEKEVRNTNIFQLKIKSKLELYVGEAFFPEDIESRKKIEKIILSVVYFHSVSNPIKDRLFSLVKDINLEVIFPYILTTENEKTKAFNFLLAENELEQEFMGIYLTGELNKTNFINMLLNKYESIQGFEDLIGLFEEVSQLIISNNKAELELNTLDDSTTLKGNIFQLLVGKFLFKENDKVYYNNKGGGKAGSLYPDIIFKANSKLFICDTKCYKNNKDISPHKEFFYNIILAEASKKETLGILFAYSKLEADNYFEIKQCYKLQGHYFFLIALNIKKCVHDLLKNDNNKSSLSSDIAKDISDILEKIKISFNEDKDYMGNIELIKFNISKEIIDFCT